MKKLVILFALTVVSTSGFAHHRYCDIYYNEHMIHEGIFKMAEYFPHGIPNQRGKTILCLYSPTVTHALPEKYETGRPVITTQTAWGNLAEDGIRVCEGSFTRPLRGDVVACPFE